VEDQGQMEIGMGLSGADSQYGEKKLTKGYVISGQIMTFRL
jgi:hypothetical protein